METYIEYLNNSMNETSDSEFNNYLSGGGNMNLDGGFPPVYECNSITNDTVQSERAKERNVTNINKKSLSSILDNRRKTPFLKIVSSENNVNRVITEVNSDSITEINKQNNTNNLGGFLNLFESDNSIELPENLSIISRNVNEFDENNNSSYHENSHNVLNNDTLELPSSLEIISKNEQSGGNLINDNSESVMLPDNLDIVELNNQSGGLLAGSDSGSTEEEDEEDDEHDLNEELEGGNIAGDSDSIMLPETIDIVSLNNMKGGNIVEDSDSILSPVNINIVSFNNQSGGNLIEISDSDSIMLPDNLAIVQLNNINRENVESISNDSDSIMLPENLDIVSISNLKGGNFENVNSDSDSIMQHVNLEIISSNNQNGGYNDISSETELDLPTNIEVVNL